MKSFFQSNMSPTRDIPRNDYQAIMERLKESELNQLKLHGERMKQVNKIKESHENKLVQLIGKKKMKRFREFLADLQRSKSDILLPPGNTRDGYDKWQKIHLRHISEANAFLKEAGVDYQKLKEINLSIQAQYRNLLPDTPTQDGNPLTILLPEEISFSDNGSPNENATIIRPPYPFGLELAHDYRDIDDNFAYRPSYVMNATTGLVGGSSILENSNASDWDSAVTEYDTMVGFYYQMPATGLLEVWIEVQSSLSKNHLNLKDEFGWSDASAYQVNYLVMTAFSASQTSEPKLCEMSRFDVEDETDGFWNLSPLTDGNTYWAHLFSSVPFEEGENVMVLVGTRNFHSSISNDVEVNSVMEFNWFIRSVYLNSTGTPSNPSLINPPSNLSTNI